MPTQHEEILPGLYFIQRGYLNANHFAYRSEAPVLIKKIIVYTIMNGGESFYLRIDSPQPGRIRNTRSRKTPMPRSAIPAADA